MTPFGLLLPLTLFSSVLVWGYGHDETPYAQTNGPEAYAQRTYFYAGGQYVNTTTVRRIPKVRLSLNAS